MDAENSIQRNYAQQAEGYEHFATLPLGILEKQLFELSIVHCDGQRVLDLGGGTGLRARDAIKAGAREVDVVDISRDMIRKGQQYEKSIGRDCINWYQGDASKPLDHLPLGMYDMVIANGISDHAHSSEELEAMWRNAAMYLKPGGRLVANRNNPRSRCAVDGKYGVTITDMKPFPGGLSFSYRMSTDPPLVFESLAVDDYSLGSLEIIGKFFTDFKNVPWQETPVVKEDSEFWKAYLEDPILYVFTAKKPE